MKNKKLLLPAMIILLGILIAVLTTIFFCIAKKPTVTQHSFPFSITYEIDSKTVTIEDEYFCSYIGPTQSVNPKDRFYDGDFTRKCVDPQCGDYLIQAYDDGELIIITNFYAGYMMGDPKYDDHYTEYYRFEPYIAFYVYDDYIEYDDEETLARFDARIVDWEYPEPIENSFVFDRLTRLTPGNVLPMAAVSLLTLFACIIFVKKECKPPFGTIDTASVVLNFIIGLAALPFLLVVSMMIDINGDGADAASQIAYCVPAITGFGLAASVCLRRNGFSKGGLFVQLAGIAAFALVLVMDVVDMIFY